MVGIDRSVTYTITKLENSIKRLTAETSILIHVSIRNQLMSYIVFLRTPESVNVRCSEMVHMITRVRN